MDIYPNTVLEEPDLRMLTPSTDGTGSKKPFSGLCKLLGRFSLPIKEKCEEWAYDEVLPPIRKSGGYRLTAAKKTSPE